MKYLVTFETMEDDVGMIIEDEALISIDATCGDVLAQIKEELSSFCRNAIVVAYLPDGEDDVNPSGYFC